MSFVHPISAEPLPSCYRHPDRPTRLSCGRCGKPLCPECVKHGPVGIRCRECLQPARTANLAEFAPPQRLSLALAGGGVMAIFWMALFIGLGMRLAQFVINYQLPNSLTFTPNLLLSGIAGGLVGWIIWRICGRTCNKITIACALMFAAAVPLFSTLILVVQYQHFLPKSPGHFALRVLIAIVISVAFAFLTTTQIHWGEEK